jgi:cell division septation protein DedD
MANYERGAYEPSDEVRVYDGADDEDDEEGSRLPILIVMALLVLAAFGGVVWLAYERGVASGRTEPRIITAEQSPVKVPPPAAANNSEAPFKGLKIYEQPAPSDEEAGTAATNTTGVNPAMPATKPATAMAAAPMVPAVTPPPATAPKPAATKPVPVHMAAVAPSVTSKPAATTNAAAAAKPATPVASKPAAAPVVANNVAHPAAPEQSSPKPAPVAADTTATPVPAGAYLLQIGAYKSQEEADASWKAFAAKHASLLAGFSSNVKQVGLGEKGTWYRLRVGSFADKDVATALCEKLKADGGNCFLAK